MWLYRKNQYRTRYLPLYLKIILIQLSLFLDVITKENDEVLRSEYINL